MKLTLKLEELAMFAIACFAYTFLPFGWLTFILLFFLPDIGMLGYLINTRFGAVLYNLFHHKGIALAAYFIGWLTDEKYFLLAGIILFAHASFDRIFGYGLKYHDSFQHTHLGMIGNRSSAANEAEN